MIYLLLFTWVIPTETTRNQILHTLIKKGRLKIVHTTPDSEQNLVIAKLNLRLTDDEKRKCV